MQGKKGQAEDIARSAAAVAASAVAVGLTAGVTIPIFLGSIASVGAASGVSAVALTSLEAVGTGFLAIWSGTTALTPAVAAREANNSLQRDGKTVTKIHAGKTIKPSSLSDNVTAEAISYALANLDYKDLLFSKMTGKNSIRFEKPRSDTINALNEVFAVATSGNISNQENKQKIALVERVFPEREKHGAAMHVASFLLPTAEEIQKSREAIKIQDNQSVPNKTDEEDTLGKRRIKEILERKRENQPMLDQINSRRKSPEREETQEILEPRNAKHQRALLERRLQENHAKNQELIR